MSGDIGSSSRPTLHQSRKTVSFYVIETLGLQIGPQSRLMVVRPCIICSDPVKAVCSAINKVCPAFVVPFSRMCYEEEDMTVFCVMQRQFDIDTLTMKQPHADYADTVGLGFSNVTSIELKEKKSFEPYMMIPIMRLNPSSDAAVFQSLSVSQYVTKYLRTPL